MKYPLFSPNFQKHHSLVSQKNLFLEVFHKRSHLHSFLLIPADTAPSWFYRPFANILFSLGYNVFLMNYFDPATVNGNREYRTFDSLTYLDCLWRTVAYIKQEFSINKLTYIGHSRGGYIVQKFLEQNQKSNTSAILINSFFADPHMPPFPVTAKLVYHALPSLWKGCLKFPRSYYLNRFFNESSFSADILNHLYEGSNPIPARFFSLPAPIQYHRFTKGTYIYIFISLKDHALPASYQTRCAEILKASFSGHLDVRINEKPGNHFSLIESPKDLSRCIAEDVIPFHLE